MNGERKVSEEPKPKLWHWGRWVAAILLFRTAASYFYLTHDYHFVVLCMGVALFTLIVWVLHGLVRFFGRRYSWRPSIREGLTNWHGLLQTVLLVMFVLAAWEAYYHKDWNVLQQFLITWLAASAGLLLLWLLGRQFRPLVIYLRENGIMGCLRWVKERVLAPLLYGRRGKQ